MNHPGNGGRGGVEGEGETKQNTGDKTTGEPAIRKQEVANVDLLSTGLTVQKSGGLAAASTGGSDEKD